MKSAMTFAIVLLCAMTGLAQTTRPTTQPAADAGGSVKTLSADQMLDQMLKPTSNQSRPLEPIADKPMTDKSGGSGAVKPDAPVANLRREGTFVIDSLARLTHNRNGQAELTFEADGKTLKDPPMIILPNLRLMQMEESVSSSNRDLKFHITGMVTEYRGRNYVLLEKALIVPDITQQF
jgi:hypothetical protein